MAAVEDSLLAAERARVVERRGQGRRRKWIATAAASYAVDGAFLALLALAGALPAWLPWAFLAGAVLLNGAAYALTASDWNLRLRDPSLVLPQSLCGILLQAGVVFAAPQIAFPWLANLVTVLAFATIWISLAASSVLWGLCAALSAALFYGLAGRLGVPQGDVLQVTLAWLFFCVMLGRLVFLSAYSGWMRNRLDESRRKLAQTMEHVRELASHDDLTKVLNRRSILARLEQERAGAGRTGLPFCVALLDLDHFKAINDTHGHAAGDAVLQAFACTVHATMRATDIFGRYGGEEFLIVLTDTGLDGARLALERIRGAIAAARELSAALPGRQVTVSGGLAAWKPGEEASQLLARADAALYRAKANGRDRVETAP